MHSSHTLFGTAIACYCLLLLAIAAIAAIHSHELNFNLCNTWNILQWNAIKFFGEKYSQPSQTLLSPVCPLSFNYFLSLSPFIFYIFAGVAITRMRKAKQKKKKKKKKKIVRLLFFLLSSRILRSSLDIWARSSMVHGPCHGLYGLRAAKRWRSAAHNLLKCSLPDGLNFSFLSYGRNISSIFIIFVRLLFIFHSLSLTPSLSRCLCCFTIHHYSRVGNCSIYKFFASGRVCSGD